MVGILVFKHSVQNARYFLLIQHEVFGVDVRFVHIRRDAFDIFALICKDFKLLIFVCAPV